MKSKTTSSYFLKVSLSLMMYLWIFQIAYTQSLLPQNLGPAINSEYNEVNPVLSADGKTLFFTRSNHPENTFGAYDSEDIWYSELQPNGQWSAATRLQVLNIWRYNSVLSISPDGNTLLINGIFNRAGNFWKQRGLSVVTREGDGWRRPRVLNVPGYYDTNLGMKSNAFMSKDGQYLILAFSKRYNSEKTDLYFSRKIHEWRWSRPKRLKKINSGRNEEAPFLSADNKTLYFASNRKGDKADFDIYMTQPQSGNWKKWSTPVLLSDTVNSSEWESYYKINADGKGALFASTKNSLGMSDIFRIDFPEKNPVMFLAGKVTDSRTNTPLPPSTPFQVVVNGNVVDSLKINFDSASYQVKLPLGKTYTIKAIVKNYDSRTETVDVSSKKQSIRIQKNLVVERFSYAVVKGRLLIKGTNENINADANPKVLVEGVPSDSVKVDLNASTYSVRLDLGKKHRLMVSGVNLNPVPAELDLTTASAPDATLDLFAELEKTEDRQPVVQRPAERIETTIPKKFASIKGRVINKRTGDPFPPGTKLQVKVMGTTAQPVVHIDAKTSQYELSLPIGEAHVIGASTPKYYPISERIDLTHVQGETTITKDLYLAPVEEGGSVRLNNVLFELGKSALTRESYKELDRIVEFLVENPSIKIEIGGHTDNVGGADVNQRLSFARAQTVSRYLTKKGVSKNRVTVEGYGSTNPMATNSTAEGRTLNRRVEFKFLEVKSAEE
jgi:outer membrane protein OmpA-like peptidoglycan-associated protein/Tol biopolymer transport system component